MEVFKSLWRPRGNIAIPHYDTSDGVDLQVKSLLYMFKRLGIAKSGDKLEKQSIEGMSTEDLETLDRMYNLTRFEQVVFRDPHRVLVDWPKNRYRAMLILAHMPQMEHLPDFGEVHFRFTTLEADASNDEYIRTLALSDIYAEHNLPLEIRREIAASVLKRHKNKTLEIRATIILEYLRLVATEIQVARIYKAMMGKISPSHSPCHSPNLSPTLHPFNPSPTHSPTHSPIHSRPPSPIRDSRPPSPTRVKAPSLGRPGSPSRFPKIAGPASTSGAASSTGSGSSSSNNPKLTAAPKLSAAQQSSPHHSPSPSPPGSPVPGSPRLRIRTSQQNLRLSGVAPPLNANNVAPSLDAGKKHILQQARLAVKARIEKEMKAINDIDL